MIASSLMYTASAAAAHRPTGTRLHCSDGVECTAAFAAAASASVDRLLAVATTLHAIEALAALGALRCRQPPTPLPPRLRDLVDALGPAYDRFHDPLAVGSLGTFEAALAEATAGQPAPASGTKAASRL